MEQHNGKKVLFILTSSTFLLLALVLSIPTNQKNPKVSASEKDSKAGDISCPYYLSRLRAIESEVDILETEVATWSEIPVPATNEEKPAQINPLDLMPKAPSNEEATPRVFNNYARPTLAPATPTTPYPTSIPTAPTYPTPYPSGYTQP